MKRITELQPLSKEHHRALVVANRCKTVAGLGFLEDCDDYWSQTRRLFKYELEPHFLQEEKYLVPVLERIGEQRLLAQLEYEHKMIRALIDNTQEQSQQLLQSFGELLANHVRFEERELFEVLQQRMLPDELQVLREVRRH